MPDEEKITPGSIVPGPIPHPVPPGPIKPLVAPPYLLDIRRIDGSPWINPPYDTSDPTWSSKAAGGHPYDGSSEHKFEWISILTPTEEQDDEVGLAGTMVDPGWSTTDLFATHLTGGRGDYEFTIVPDSAYTNLVATSNQDRYKDDTSAAEAAGIAVPTGLLGVEIEGALVTDDFKSACRMGARCAGFGKWIVDAAHFDPSLPIPSPHSEMHSLSLMAVANSIDNSGNVTPPSENAITRVDVCTRPLMGSQLYTNNGDTGLSLRDYLTRITNIVPYFESAEFFYIAFPTPFVGIQIIALQISPPVLAQPAPGWQLTADYHFTVNGSCTVEMIRSPGANSIIAVFTLNAAGYPTSLTSNWPTHVDTYQVQDLLNQAPPGVNLDWLQELWADLIGEINVHHFDAAQTSKTQDTVNVQKGIPVTGSLPDGTALDGNCAYPVYGWIELFWKPPAPDVR